MTRQNIPSGSYLEPIIGFSRAVRIGNFVSVAGTGPIAPEGGTSGVGDAAAQMRRCIEISLEALAQAGASASDVIRTRIMVTNIDDWEAVARVHGETFKDIRPVTTVVEVKGFVDPDWLVETEMEAIVNEEQA